MFALADEHNKIVFNTERSGRKMNKSVKEKRIRKKKDELLDELFELFSKRSYWTRKNLIMETEQPEDYLKSVLNEICIYNKKGQHKGFYQLNHEYTKQDLKNQQ